jgi:hypothetical protein
VGHVSDSAPVLFPKLVALMPTEFSIVTHRLAMGCEPTAR